MRRNTTEMIEIIIPEGRRFKKKLSQGRFQMTGIIEANGEAIHNTERIVERAK